MILEQVKTEKLKKDLGFQVSVTKVFPVSTEILWEFLLSKTGLYIWLGEIDLDDFELQRPFVTNEGIEVKLTVFVPDSHLRFKRKPKQWDTPATVELRVTKSKGKSSLIFHITGFFKIEQKEELRAYYKSVISRIFVELVDKSIAKVHE